MKPKMNGKDKQMRTTIEAIMRHVVPPAKREPARKASAIVLAQKQSGSNELYRRQMHSNKVSLPYQAPLIFSSVASDTHSEEGMKDQKKIRLGLIGVGNWALFGHVRVLRLLPEYEIVAIYSQRKEAAKAAATEYGIPHVAGSLNALVRDPLVDQVLVLTTSQQHEEGIR